MYEEDLFVSYWMLDVIAVSLGFIQNLSFDYYIKRLCIPVDSRLSVLCVLL